MLWSGNASARPNTFICAKISSIDSIPTDAPILAKLEEVLTTNLEIIQNNRRELR